MSWLLVALLAVAAWFVVKTLGMVLRLALWAAIVGIGYWYLAPRLGLPWPPF